MSRRCVAETLQQVQQLEAAVRHQCGIIVRHRHWVKKARGLRSLGHIDMAADCLLHAAECRAFYVEGQSRVKRLKAEVLEFCHD